MEKPRGPIFCRSKVWLEDADGEVIFGFGRVRILEAIERHGSIHAAAKELKMGYRAVWARISATENRLGEKLLVKQVGGASGGGSQLTPLAQALIKNFKKVQASVEKMTDELFSNLMGDEMDIKKK
jgi:molybdate transport system regulatory protein